MAIKMVALMAATALAAATLTAAAPEIASRPAQVLRYDLDTSNMPNSYKFAYESSDGSARSEQGGIGEPGTPEGDALRVRGTTRWITDTGSLYEMSYLAGKRGYRTIIKKIS